MNNLRNNRLKQDYLTLKVLSNKFNYFEIEKTEGNPPISYQFNFKFPGFIDKNGKTRNNHQVIMKIPSGYPMNDAPRFDFLTRPPVYHPNVSTSGWICLGFGHRQDWHFGYNIEDLICQVAEIIIFTPESHNLASKANSTNSDWISWIENQKIPLYSGPLFPDDIIAKNSIQKNQKSKVSIRSKKQKELKKPLVKVRNIVTSKVSAQQIETPVISKPIVRIKQVFH